MHENIASEVFVPYDLTLAGTVPDSRLMVELGQVFGAPPLLAPPPVFIALHIKSRFGLDPFKEN